MPPRLGRLAASRDREQFCAGNLSQCPLKGRVSENSAQADHGRIAVVSPDGTAFSAKSCLKLPGADSDSFGHGDQPFGLPRNNHFGCRGLLWLVCHYPPMAFAGAVGAVRMLEDHIFEKEEAMGTRATIVLVAGLVLALAASSPCPVQAQGDSPRRAVLELVVKANRESCGSRWLGHHRACGRRHCPGKRRGRSHPDEDRRSRLFGRCGPNRCRQSGRHQLCRWNFVQSCRATPA